MRSLKNPVSRFGVRQSLVVPFDHQMPGSQFQQRGSREIMDIELRFGGGHFVGGPRVVLRCALFSSSRSEFSITQLLLLRTHQQRKEREYHQQTLQFNPGKVLKSSVSLTEPRGSGGLGALIHGWMDHVTSCCFFPSRSRVSNATCAKVQIPCVSISTPKIQEMDAASVMAPDRIHFARDQLDYSRNIKMYWYDAHGEVR